MSKQGDFERWMIVVSEQLRSAKNQVKALEERLKKVEERTDLTNIPKRGKGTTPGGPMSQTLDIGIYKITVDGGDGTYTAHRCYSHSAAGWTDMNTAGIDTTNYTLVSVFEKQIGYIGMHGVGDYVLARYDGENGTSAIYHMYDMGSVPGIFDVPLSAYPAASAICT